MRLKYCAMVGCLLMAMVAMGYGQASDQAKQDPTPIAQTPRWHYERALIYHLREQDGRANIELLKALDKDDRYTEAYYFIARLRQAREHWAEVAQALDMLMILDTRENIPAKLLFAQADVESGNYLRGVKTLEQITEKLKLPASFSDSLQRAEKDADSAASFPKNSRDLDIVKKFTADLKQRLELLIEEAEDNLNDSPAVYRDATLAQGLKDAMIYEELLQLYEEEVEGDTIPPETLPLLQELLAVRQGFAPGVLLRMGRIYEQQKRYVEAVAALELAVGQLKALGFSEAAGDFSTEELQQLRARVQPASKPTAVKPAKGGK